MIDSFSKEEVPLCIEYIGEENCMLLGSESGDILTHPIGDYMQMNKDDWEDFIDEKKAI